MSDDNLQSAVDGLRQVMIDIAERAAKGTMASKNARKCDYCSGRLLHIAHTDAFGNFILICRDCGKGTIVGKSNAVSTVAASGKLSNNIPGYCYS